MDVEFSTEIDLSRRDEPAADPPFRLTDPELFARIDAYTIGPDDAALSFTSRLARENDWSDRYAAEVIGEYKRFIYLICISASPLTPSRDVDEVWHLHLTYSRDYWERFCRNVLGRDLHHTPTEGGEAEAGKFWSLYEETLCAYKAEFQENPPRMVWPSAELRFSDDAGPVKVSGDRYFIVSKRYGASLTVAGATLFFAGATLAVAYPNPFYLAMLVLMGILLLITAAAGSMPPNARIRTSVSGSGGSGGCGASGCGGGGCGGGD